MVRQAAGYTGSLRPGFSDGPLGGTGGILCLDDGGGNPGLLAAADLAEAQTEGPLASDLRETADAWNTAIEELIYVTGTDLARQAGVDGYYSRFARPDQMSARRPAYGEVTLQEPSARPGPLCRGRHRQPGCSMPGTIWLRAGDDPRILNTVRVIDRCLKVETPMDLAGPPLQPRRLWRAGGRLALRWHGHWPSMALVDGGMCHYELAAGRKGQASSCRERWILCPRAACPTGLGHAGHSGARIVLRAAERVRYAAGIGMRENRQLQRSLHDGMCSTCPHSQLSVTLCNKRNLPTRCGGLSRNAGRPALAERCDWKQWPPQPFVGPVMIGRASRRLNLTTRGWVFT